jgi:hypothetical protein
MSVGWVSAHYKVLANGQVSNYQSDSVNSFAGLAWLRLSYLVDLSGCSDSSNRW